MEENKPKTLQECKEKVAKKNGFQDWSDLQATWLKRTGMALVVHESYLDQHAELYAQSLLSELKKENAELREAANIGLRYSRELSEVYSDTALPDAIRQEIIKAIETIKSLLKKHESK